MAFTQFTYDMDIISKLSDSPNVDDGLTASQLKAKFDEAGKAIKDFINNVLLTEALERPTFSGMVKSNGRGFVAAEAGKDYQAPLGAGDIGTGLLADSAVTAGKLADDAVRIRVKDVRVPSGSFVTDTTDGDYPYRAAVPITGATVNMRPEVIFDFSQIASGMYSSVAESYDGGVYIYANEIPGETVVIPVVDLWR